MVTRGQLPPEVAGLYPFEPRLFGTPGGAAMSYLDEGSRGDEAALLIHGNPTWSFYFRDLVRELAPRLRCVAPDHVGMGLSDKPRRHDYRLAARTADIAALVDALGLKRIHLVVHDWGGAIGFGLAVRRPDLIGRIVILNTAAFPSARIPARIALCRAPGIGPLLVRGLNAFARGAATMAMASRRLSPAERKGYLFPYDTWSNRIGVNQFIRDIPMEAGHPSRRTLEETAATLGRLAAHKKLILWGGRDFCFDQGILSRWRGIYPDANCIVYDHAGHYVLEDAGLDARVRIRNFLSPPTP